MSKNKNVVVRSIINVFFVALLLGFYISVLSLWSSLPIPFNTGLIIVFRTVLLVSMLAMITLYGLKVHRFYPLGSLKQLYISSIPLILMAAFTFVELVEYILQMMINWFGFYGISFIIEIVTVLDIVAYIYAAYIYIRFGKAYVLKTNKNDTLKVSSISQKRAFIVRMAINVLFLVAQAFSIVLILASAAADAADPTPLIVMTALLIGLAGIIYLRFLRKGLMLASNKLLYISSLPLTVMTLPTILLIASDISSFINNIVSLGFLTQLDSAIEFALSFIVLWPIGFLVTYIYLGIKAIKFHVEQ